MSKFNFNALARKLRSQYPAILEKMANNAVNHFKVDNFDAEAFIDEVPERWAPRKSKRDNAGRRLLVKTGRGRAGIKVLSRTGNSVKIGTLVPYMKYHNEGTARLPKRQFIGDSGVLQRKNGKVLNDAIDKTIKSYGGR